MKPLSPMDEMRLYTSDHKAWVTYSAHQWIFRMEGKSEDEKRSTWKRVPESVRAEIQRIKRETVQRVLGDVDAANIR